MSTVETVLTQADALTLANRAGSGSLSGIKRLLRSMIRGEGYQTYAGNPNGNLTPNGVGDRCFDSTNGVLFVSRGTLNSDWRPIIDNPLSQVSLLDDFTTKTIDPGWDLQKGSDGACVNFAVNAQLSGAIRGTMGANVGLTYATNGVQLSRGLNWQANKGNLVFEARWKLSAITTIAAYIGFTDQLAALEMPATLGAADALTTNMTDGVGILFDTAADTDNIWAVGVANDVDATKQNLAVAPTIATYETIRIEVTAAGVASFFRNGVAIGAAMTGAVTPTIPLTPVICGFTRAAGAQTLDVDYVLVSQNR
jgi:hypothetical protein